MIESFLAMHFAFFIYQKEGSQSRRVMSFQIFFSSFVIKGFYQKLTNKGFDIKKIIALSSTSYDEILLGQKI